ncbi:MAG: TerB family tellurite resistance protein [Spirochaetales bacterium]|nr:TerB family tellurite resistance protein [Spirochaetales bacterium]
MDKNYALLNVLVNLAYVDNNIDASEVAMLKKYAKEKNISYDVDKMIADVKDTDNDNIIAEYAKSIAFLTTNLTEEEKKNFIYDAVNLANADDDYAENEYISIEALARNWNIYFG